MSQEKDLFALRFYDKATKLPNFIPHCSLSRYFRKICLNKNARNQLGTTAPIRRIAL